ncbi:MULTISPECIES: hypothetical protein [Streptomyces]|uniref:hypothetical protein n=1 Tax=Streptomyces TaxID=1883 RepID=UPI002271380C|nr:MULTISPECIES: hypothetical protein [unclassified Streptomyces]MCY0943035.1 hypothetical protein [Streptomyces sp. H34-AA3]MCY0949786.1 hypothetical protein [Streptomyces sp. H27-S2]MCZ4087530.1 hypothetical protein [Streptomyces sp. H34-S5]
MTFMLLTCAPMLAAVLLLNWKPREPRHRRHPVRAPRPPARRRTLIRCHLSPPLLSAMT